VARSGAEGLRGGWLHSAALAKLSISLMRPMGRGLGEPVDRPASPRVAVIGSGFGGIALAVKLHKAGIQTFTIFERSDDLGGVWNENTYPGVEVDNFAHWYSFSFRTYDWTRTHPGQAEIKEYLNDTVDMFGLRGHFRFGLAVERVIWDEGAQLYWVHLGDGTTEPFDFVVSAVGLFNEPRYPSWPGLDEFDGIKFHSARWEHEHDLSGKRVAVVGTGSTGVQIVTAIAPILSELVVFQREPGWLFSKGEHVFTPAERARLSRPLGYRRERFRYFFREQQKGWGGKNLQPGTTQNAKAQAACERYIAKIFRDRPDLAMAVTPTYPYGGKRQVLASGFYESLLLDHVSLVPKAVERVTKSGIVDADGREHEIDALIMATGFKAADYLNSLEVVGRDGCLLSEVWHGEPQAFLGMSVPGFPNFAMLYGPNTNQGNVVFGLETSANYVVRNIKRMRRTGVTSIDVRLSTYVTYNRWLQWRLAKSALATAKNYHKSRSGRLVLPFPTNMGWYWFFCRSLRRLATVQHRDRNRSEMPARSCTLKMAKSVTRNGDFG
jgi:cation diffusion facilitator CzcD-associated flavoprotein CzcO